MRRLFAGNDVDFSEARAAGFRRCQFWLEQAVRYTKPLEPRKHDRDVHDLGFLFLSTYYRWYRLSNDPAHREVLIQAGRTLAMRFQG